MSKIANGCVDLFRGFEPAPPEPTVHATELFTREAITVIEKHAESDKEKPMFLMLSYTAPHDPLQADPEFFEGPCANIPHPTRRRFCAMMAQLDNGINRVVESLKKSGMWEDTLFAFASDNGGMPVVGGGNYPYRGIKSSAWEGGVRAPAFIITPDWLEWPSGVSFDGLFHVADWMPTLLSIASGSHKKPLPVDMDGKDISTALRTQGPSPRTNAVLQLDVFLHSASYRSGCLKILVGRPGPNLRVAEPNEHSLIIDVETGKAANYGILDFAFPIIEALVKPPIDQFFKYALTIQIAVVYDFFHGTKLNHIVHMEQPSEAVLPNAGYWLPESGENIDMYLYDLCVDPTESYNLAQDPAHHAETMRLYAELRAEAYLHPVKQYAGDAIVRDSNSEKGCVPWLPDDADIDELLRGSGRVFIRMITIITIVECAAVAVIFIALPCSLCFCCKCLCKKRKQTHEHKE